MHIRDAINRLRKSAHELYAEERNAVVDKCAPVFEEAIRGKDLQVVLIVASPVGYTVASSLPTDKRAIALARFVADHHEGKL